MTVIPFEDGVSLWVDQEKGCDVLDMPEGYIFPDSHSPGLYTVPLDRPAGRSFPVQGTLLRPFHTPQVITRVFSLISEWAHR